MWDEMDRGGALPVDKGRQAFICPWASPCRAAVSQINAPVHCPVRSSRHPRQLLPRRDLRRENQTNFEFAKKRIEHGGGSEGRGRVMSSVEGHEERGAVSREERRRLSFLP